jgi:hypothetical protein
VIQKKWSIFWGVIVSVIVRKSSYEHVSNSEWLPRLYFCSWRLMNSEVYRRKVDTRDELLARILDAAVRIKKREDQLRRITRDLSTRVAKCTEVGGGILERLL